LEGSKVTEKDRQTLKKLLSTLKEEDNNVVFIWQTENIAFCILSGAHYPEARYSEPKTGPKGCS